MVCNPIMQLEVLEDYTIKKIKEYYFLLSYCCLILLLVLCKQKKQNIVYVFKTSVKDKRQVKSLTGNLNKIHAIKKWNFNLEDCDNILRIVSDIDVSNTVCETFDVLNYSCIELE